MPNERFMQKHYGANGFVDRKKYPEPTPEIKGLLLRAADKLQDYCAEINGDMNDPLAKEIRDVLARIQYGNLL